MPQGFQDSLSSLGRQKAQRLKYICREKIILCRVQHAWLHIRLEGGVWLGVYCRLAQGKGTVGLLRSRQMEWQRKENEEVQ